MKIKTRIYKHTVISLTFGIIAGTRYILQYTVDTDLYRKYLSLSGLFIFYPSLFISLLFSIRAIILIYKIRNLKNRTLLIFLNLLTQMFFIYFLMRAVIVLIKPV